MLFYESSVWLYSVYNGFVKILIRGPSGAFSHGFLASRNLPHVYKKSKVNMFSNTLEWKDCQRSPETQTINEHEDEVISSGQEHIALIRLVSYIRSLLDGGSVVVLYCERVTASLEECWRYVCFEPPHSYHLRGSPPRYGTASGLQRGRGLPPTSNGVCMTKHFYCCFRYMGVVPTEKFWIRIFCWELVECCLLYTSDAADE